eukprot:5994253-Karenia_brevis.AAC.1
MSNSQQLPVETCDAYQQQVLSKSLHEARHAEFKAELAVTDRAYINSETLAGASDWLVAWP